MPTLAREPDIYPAELLDSLECCADKGLTWWGLYCRPNHEKQLMRRLHDRQVRFYSPLIARRSRTPAGRTRTAYRLLFPGYVFVYGDSSDRYLAMTTGCVSRWLPVPDPQSLTRDLQRIYTLIESGVPLTPEGRLQPGQRVRICSGPFQGIEGVVLRRGGQTRLLVAVRFLQQGASMLIDDYSLEPIT